MKMTHVQRVLAFSGLTVSLALGACGGEEETPPPSAPLEAPESPVPAAEAIEVALTTQGSTVDFVMEAPVEHIHGRAPNSVQGSLTLDLEDLAQSRGLVKFDLFELEILQSKIDEDTQEFEEEHRDDMQNDHMRTWFQISDDAPEEEREANRWVEFRIDEVTGADHNNVSEMTGDERRVTLNVAGQLRVHGVTVDKTAALALVFHYDGDTFQSVDIGTAEPINVNLAEHHIEPRSSFERLAARTLAEMGPKVADDAPVTFTVNGTPASE